MSVGDESAALHRLRAVFAEEGALTLEEIAADHGVRVEDVVATRYALGLTAELGQPVYGAELEDHARRLQAATAAGLPVEALVELNRVIGRATSTIVAAARDAVMDMFAGQPGDWDEMATASVVGDLAPELERVVGYAFREHARELTRREAGAVLAGRSTTTLHPMAIGFADLVGFTHLGDLAGPEALSTAAHRLESLAAAACRPPTTVVKTIGDAVMVVSPEPEALVTSLLELLAAADAAGPDLPRLRAGAAWGPTISRAGDWYGAAVNLASRLTALARPGELAAATGIAEPTADRPWGPVEDHAVRGVTDPVAVRRLQPFPGDSTG